MELKSNTTSILDIVDVFSITANNKSNQWFGYLNLPSNIISFTLIWWYFPYTSALLLTSIVCTPPTIVGWTGKAPGSKPRAYMYSSTIVIITISNAHGIVYWMCVLLQHLDKCPMPCKTIHMHMYIYVCSTLCEYNQSTSEILMKLPRRGKIEVMTCFRICAPFERYTCNH